MFTYSPKSISYFCIAKPFKMRSRLSIYYIFTLIFTTFNALSQAPVTRIYTDYNGFLMSSTASVQSPDPSSQNLLAFQTGGTIWSTGVNDAVLNSNSILYTSLNFQAMPATVVGGNSSAVIGIGRQYGGYIGSNGCDPAVPAPFGSNVSNYLTDGIQGLDISTGIFNIGGTINYTVSAVQSTSIGDGIPDILITQIGDLNSSLDRFRFKDASNNTVGNQVNVDFSTVNTVMRPNWKFYSLSTLNCGASGAGTRETRVLAFDLADLGITPANYANITQFEQILTANSDVAFVAYNTLSTVILPVTLVDFKAELIDREVKLNWETASEQNSDYFVIERSLNTQNWEEVTTQKAANNSNSTINYEDYDKSPYPGGSYYRLKIVDNDGSFTTSNIVAINWKQNELNIFPNPASNILSIRGKSIGEIAIIDVTGKDVTQQTTILNSSSNFVQINIETLTQGLYFVNCKNEVYQIVKQ